MQAPGSNLSTKVFRREQKTNSLLALLTSKLRVKLTFAMLFFSRCQMLKSGLLLYLNEASPTPLNQIVLALNHSIRTS